jgi:hypothetical protein
VLICVKLAEECPQDSCLPRSDLSCQGNESYTIVNAVQKVCKGFFVVLAQEDKTGVRSQVERFFSEAMKVKVHQKIPLDTSTSSNEKRKNKETTKFFFNKAHIEDISFCTGQYHP